MDYVDLDVTISKLRAKLRMRRSLRKAHFLP
jgi:hypothetical protein